MTTAPPPRVKTLQLADEPRPAGAPRGPAAAAPRSRFAITPRTSWLIPPAMLSATLVGVSLVFHAPDGLFGASVGTLFGVGLLWALISVFFPGRAEHRCPSCGAEALERLDPQAVVGLRCASCGWQDADVSSWMLAEEEGVTLEDIVMETRGRKRDAAPQEEARP